MQVQKILTAGLQSNIKAPCTIDLLFIYGAGRLFMQKTACVRPDSKA